VKQIWNWQNRAVKALYAHTGDHFWVHAPTGTGKTNFIYKAIEKGPQYTNSIIMVGRGDIVAQHRSRFVELGAKPLFEENECSVFITKKKNTVTIATWQGLARYADDPLPVNTLFFDECHLGGSWIGNTSFPKIVSTFNPSMKVYLSATTQMADERLLGKRDGNIFYYPIAQAYEDGLLNPVDLVEVQVGQRLDLARIQSSLKTNIEKIEELSDDSLERLAKKLKDKKAVIDAQSFMAIAATRGETMCRIYLERHRGEQAIFYCSEINRANNLLNVFKSLARKKSVRVTAVAAHTQERDFQERINSFRAGEVDVIFVVGMLQEGFDLPDLALAFDCRFFPVLDMKRQGRMIQRVGRLIRKSPDKPISKYYFARDITNFYNSSAADKAFPDMSSDDVSAMLMASVLSYAVDGARRGGDVRIAYSATEYMKGLSLGNQSRVTLKTTPLFRVDDVRGYRILAGCEYRKLIGSIRSSDEIDAIVEDLKRRAERGERKPTSNSELAQVMYYAIHANRCGFKTYLESIGSDWLSRNRTPEEIDAIIEELKELAKRGDKRPHRKTEYGMNLERALLTNRCGIRTYLESIGSDWLPKRLTSKETDAIIEGFKEQAKRGDKRPHAQTEYGRILNKALMKDRCGIKTYLQSIGSDWVAQNRTSEEIDAIIEGFKDHAKRGDKRPHHTSEHGQILSQALVRNRCGIKTYLESIGSDWLSRNRTSEEFNAIIEELKELAKRGVKRPSQKTEYGWILTRALPDDRCGIKTYLESIGSDWLPKRLTSEETYAIIEGFKEQAKRGDKRPHTKTEYGRILNNAIVKDRFGIKTYLQSIESDWLSQKRTSDDTDAIIEELKELAKRGSKRPLSRSEFGWIIAHAIEKDRCGFRTFLIDINSDWFTQKLKDKYKHDMVST
jgi:superfamily II DNA or RNA helicase/Ser-tRNA(Ala) deacylase AlaX